MNPTNRRIKRQELPPGVFDEGDPKDFEPLALDEVAPPRESLPPEIDARDKRDAKPKARIVSLARAIVGVALVIGVSCGVAWAARKHVMSSGRFAVKDVDVNGAHHRAPDEIVREAGLSLGQNVFTVDLEGARQKLLADPWISDATLGRRLPGTLLVQVTEREAGALVAIGDTYLATRSGELFKKIEPGDPTDLPIITGLKADSVADDREGAARSIRRAIDLANEYEHGPVAARAQLEEIHVGEDGSMTLVIGKNALALMLGEPPYRKKLDQAARVLAELDKRGAKADAIMLDNEARPERVVVRMK